MGDRPILFSAPMVRAILAGTKTQTRRVVRKQFAPDALVAEVAATTPEGWQVSGHSGLWWDDAGACFDDAVRCPYGMPGDRLWVRETWRVCGGREYEYQQDRSQVMYRATHQEDGFPLTWESYGWRPSIHMPRWASRITLEVTDVRVERLQDISEADAIADGIERIGGPASCSPWRNYWLGARGADGMHCSSAVMSYRSLWESINGRGSWDANPWVWVVSFRRAGTQEADRG